MKRQASGADGGGASKRPAPADDGAVGDLGLLRRQNKMLGQELVRYKRHIGESREELEMIRGKSRDMEALVSAVQRAWSQLDIDASMLLDSLGDSEIPEQETEHSELLVRLLKAGSSSRKLDPTDLSNLSKLDVDQWTTADEIEKERVRVEHEMEEEAMDAEFGGSLDETLGAHAAFTLTLLERLCRAIGEAGTFAQAPEVINALTEAKELHAERLVLTDRITKLNQEVGNFSAKLHNCERQKMLIERDLIRAQTSLAEIASGSGSGSGGEGSSGGAGGDAASSASAASAIEAGGADAAATASGGGGLVDAKQKEREKELVQKIEILEKQLGKSEEDKSKADLELTRRMVQPVTASGHADQLRKALDDLREQMKKFLNGQNADMTALQDKVSNLELGMQQLEAACAAKCREAAGQAEMEIKSMRSSRDAMQSSLFRANSELAINSQLKTQVAELQALEAAQRAEAVKMAEKIRVLSESQEMLQGHLAASRAREASLEQERSGGGGGGSSSPEALALAQARAAESHKELEHARASINDLILEIDAVSAEESKAREQSARVLRAMTDAQNSHKNVTEDNMRMHDQIAELQRRHGDMENRLVSATSILKQQEQIISQATARENSLLTEVHALRLETRTLQGIKKMNEQQLQEAQQSLELRTKDVEGEVQRSTALKERCDELAQKLEAERKLKMAAERELKPKAVRAAAPASGGGGLNNADSALLDMTLGMLRCTVCRDRFKDTCLTRCFHLFCKECVDELVRNRSRKCPMCAERFGDADIRPVFFGSV